MTVLQTAGLSHSEIRGSMVICTYPQLIAAYHVLHRLREPRHPPCALARFISALHNTPSPHRLGGKGQKARQAYTSGCQNCIVYDSIYLQSCLCQYVKERFHRISGQHEPQKKTAKREKPRYRRTVENNGFEPLTPCLQSRCSSQLS